MAWVNRYDDRAAIGMAHDVMAAADSRDRESGTFKRLDNLRLVLPGWRQASGDVERQRQLIRRAGLGEQDLQRLAQVGDSGFWGGAVAYRADAGAELGGGAPDAVLILLYGVGHMNNAGHDTDCRISLQPRHGAGPIAARIGRNVKPFRLHATSPEVRAWWNRHHVAPLGGGTKRLRHPQLGEIDLPHVVLQVADNPEHKLVTFTPSPDDTERIAALIAGRRPGTTGNPQPSDSC
jgi:hypothetical protein